MIMPGVQNPHWTAPYSANAFYGLLVDNDGACAAEACSASIFGPGETQIGPQHPQQGSVAVDI